MSTDFQSDVSGTVLQRMRDGGFDFSRLHVIEFYAVFPAEEAARRVAGHFHGESHNAQVSRGEDGDWCLQVSRVMYATSTAIEGFSQGLEALMAPLGGVADGWGVTQDLRLEQQLARRAQRDGPACRVLK